MSVRLRLALWSSGLVGLAILLAGVLAYGIHGRELYTDQDMVLKSAAEHAQEEYELSSPVRIATTSSDLLVQVFDEGGSLLTSTASSTALPPVDPIRLRAQGSSASPFAPILGLGPAPPVSNPGPDIFGLLTDSSGHRWRFFLLPVGDPPQRYFLAAANLQKADASMAFLRQLVGILAGASAAITLLATWTVVDRTIKPVDRLTKAAADITHSRRLDHRVPVYERRDELGRLARTLNDMLAALEESSLAQQRFISDASHELRAPLTAIQGNLELLKDNTEMSPEGRAEAIAEASRETERLARLVADLLALARADAGIPIRTEEVDLDRVLLDAVAEARHLGRGQKLEIAQLEPVSIKGDQDRLKQLCLILLDNALKYTPPTGNVKVSLTHGDHQATVSVRDNGVGIPGEALSHVFERFYRADHSRARDPGGTGLGLPIARWIAEQHGGEVSLESEIGHGTTASVRLPLDG